MTLPNSPEPAESPGKTVVSGPVARIGAVAERLTLLCLHAVRRYYLRGWKVILPEIAAFAFLSFFSMAFLGVILDLIAGQHEPYPAMIAVVVILIAGTSLFLVRRSRNYIATDPRDQNIGRQAHRDRMVALIIAVAIIASVGVAAARNPSQPRWDAFPRTLSCETIQNPDSTIPELPDSARVRNVTLNHTGEDAFTATFTFVGSVPPLPRRVRSPYNGDQIVAAGDTDLNVILQGPDNRSISAGGLEGRGWYGGRMDKAIDAFLNSTPLDDSPNLVPAYGTNDHDLVLKFDLQSQSDFFADGRFTPDMHINQFVHGAASSDFPDGQLISEGSQHCAWDSAVTTSPSTAAPASAPSTSSTRSAPARAPSTSSTRSAAAGPAGVFDKRALPTEACVSQGVCQLSSPSGNFYCTIFPAGDMRPAEASCVAPKGEALSDGLIVSMSGSGLQMPTNRISVDENGKIDTTPISAGVNKMYDREQIKPYTVPYGTQMTAFGFTCAVDPDTGVSCRNNANSHGFSVTRQAHHFF